MHRRKEKAAAWALRRRGMRLPPFPFSWQALRAVFAAGLAARYAGVRRR
jgi:hypothetical protein